ncbi:hypothetical protein FACS1894202_09150 [Clostridia bacterium]|nr:hypothetical protein FACS1894202_09150 [Clostridia bacterium]
MKINISDIRVKERIRKEVTKIEELAEDIRQNGLISPIAVMSVDDDGGRLPEYQLLAGLRRLRATEQNGETVIEANVFPASDAEAALKIEFAENEQREPFTFSEKMEYTRLIEDIETAKAKERMLSGKKADPVDGSPQGDSGKSRDVIGAKIGMSGRQYSRAKFVAEHAAPEVIEQLDKKETSVRKAYDNLRAAERTETVPKTLAAPVREQPAVTHVATPKCEPPKKQKLSDKEKEERAMAMLSPKDREAIERNNAFAAMSPNEKIIDLQRQLREERCRAVTAETELERLKVDLHNAVMHRDGTIHSLERQLENAHARIKELEGKQDAHTD